MSTTPPKSDLKSPRKFGAPVFLAWALLTFYAAIFAANYLFLFHLYGVARVRSEHLHFTEMSKAHPWVVSNGDRVTEGYFLHYLIGLGLWIPLFIATFCFVYRLLPEQKDPS